MKKQIIIYIIALLCLWNTPATAFWGSDSAETASGLDVTTGFDVNTITTLKGTVVTVPERRKQEQHTVMIIDTNRGSVTAMLGPWDYWDKQTIRITKSQDVSITGSLAQGKDGLLYLFAQRLEILNSGETVTLRNETGKPLWSHSGFGSQNGTRQQSGSGHRPGSGLRGGTRGGRR